MEFLIGFISGVVVTGVYVVLFIRSLKANELVVFEATDKMRKYLGKKDKK